MKGRDINYESPFFLGCLFIGLGIGFLIDEVVAGGLIGMGIGLLVGWWFDNK
jgi:F0F1-type ATP synthase assembly protein I